jgi:hypothetical protein
MDFSSLIFSFSGFRLTRIYTSLRLSLAIIIAYDVPETTEIMDRVHKNMTPLQTSDHSGVFVHNMGTR